jgi:hypothetical protein
MSSKLDQAQIFQDIHNDETDSINVRNIGSLVPEAYDAILKTNTSATVETFTYYLGGLAGSLIATVTVTYTDSTKDDLVSVVRT